MASNFFALFDDIATLLDDVSIMTKVAARKTAGLLGDDLALNAQQVSGVEPSRELPVVWAVAKGSLLNKFILVPAALILTAVAPWALTPLLILGGLYLCYEGVEKVWHLIHTSAADAEHKKALRQAVSDASVDVVDFEKNKIKGAIRTDFILSAEIIVITLSAVADSEPSVRIAVVSVIALLMTVGVYGAVALIVKLDDFGRLLLMRDASATGHAFSHWLGESILWFAPKFMKGLSIVGTAAMFMVGGGILTHGVAAVAPLIQGLAGAVGVGPDFSGVFTAVARVLFDMLVASVAGAICLVLVTLIRGNQQHSEVDSTS